jgi:hypothetical protein
MLSTRGITRLIEIREFGDNYELDLQAASFPTTALKDTGSSTTSTG